MPKGISRLIFVALFGSWLSGCHIQGSPQAQLTQPFLNPVLDDQQARAQIATTLNKFESLCLNRDLHDRPFPALDAKSPDYVVKSKDSCSSWWQKAERWGHYDRSFPIYNRHAYFINELKKRFGVIYHHSGPAVENCSNNRLHTMLLRDGETILEVDLTTGSKRGSFCGDTPYYHRYVLRLFRWHNQQRDEAAPYVLTRLNVLNLGRLTDEEKQQVADDWASRPDKEDVAKRIAKIIEGIQEKYDYYAELNADFRASDRAFEARREAERRASSASLNRALMQAFSTPNPTSAGSGGFNPVSPRSTSSFSAPRPPVTPAALGGIKGFNSAQLPESIDRSKLPQPAKPVQPSSTSSSGVVSKSASASAVKPTQASAPKSKLYEPMPTTANGSNDVWHGDRNHALFLARLGAVNEISSQCSTKGARADRPDTSQIKAGAAPVRWQFSAPSCQQGGAEGKEWKCSAGVSGTCYRMQ